IVGGKRYLAGFDVDVAERIVFIASARGGKVIVLPPAQCGSVAANEADGRRDQIGKSEVHRVVAQVRGPAVGAAVRAHALRVARQAKLPRCRVETAAALVISAAKSATGQVLVQHGPAGVPLFEVVAPRWGYGSQGAQL